MSKSTTVPTANTFAEAFPNSTKVFDETFVDTPNGLVQLRVPVREVTLSGGERRPSLRIVVPVASVVTLMFSVPTATPRTKSV